MTNGHAHPHPYHLVDPSPWPIIGAISAFLAFGGGVLFMHSDRTLADAAVMILGFFGILYTMVRWFTDVALEGESGSYHTPVVQVGLRFGMALFIMSEVLFFAAFFWAYFNASLFPTEQIGSVWPPNGMDVFNPWDIPFINTIILLSSGGTVTIAHHGLRHGNRGQLIGWLAITIALGLTFTGLQAYEYSHAPFRFVDGVYPSTFFIGDRVPRFSCDRRLDLPLGDAAQGDPRPLQAGPALRVRGGGLVLAFCRRRMVVPVHLRLLVANGIREVAFTRE